LYLAFLAKYPPKVLTKISATGMVEAGLAPLHIKGGSPCEYPHTLGKIIIQHRRSNKHTEKPLVHHDVELERGYSISDHHSQHSGSITPHSRLQHRTQSSSPFIGARLLLHLGSLPISIWLSKRTGKNPSQSCRQLSLCGIWFSFFSR
jgi:hypothetical protein